MKSEMTYTEFGNNLRKFRKKKGYTQEKLAEVSGVSRRMIGHYETLVKRPSIEKVKKLSKILGVTDEELLGISKTENRVKEPDLSYKVMKKLRLIEKMPVRDQNKIFGLINELAEKNKLKKND